jgi:branched-chain amino acid transport system permease protein
MRRSSRSSPPRDAGRSRWALTRRGRAFGFEPFATALLVVAAAVAILVLPALVNLYWMRVLTYALMFAALASGLNITAGFTGYPAFGDVVWFGIGSTVTAVFMVKSHWAFAPAVAVSVAFCIVIAAIVGPSLLRLRGHYFAIGTLALNEATRALVSNLGVTGGGQGLSLPITTGSVESTARFFYYLFFGVVALSVAITLALVRTRVGYGLRAIRADEDAAASLGVNTTFLKSFAWTISAGVIGLTGAIYAYFISFIEPTAVFSIADYSIKMFVIILLGGVGTVFGPILGAFGIQILESEILTNGNLTSWHLLVFGSIVIGIVLFLPEGFVTFARRRARDVAGLFAR